MAYGEKYSKAQISAVLQTVDSLSSRYFVSCFSFNDEAIPPTTLRQMGETFPDSSSTGWAFEGLIKFEPFYTEKDFRQAARICFRLLSIGLESASERILTLMKKPNKI